MFGAYKNQGSARTHNQLSTLCSSFGPETESCRQGHVASPSGRFHRVHRTVLNLYFILLVFDDTFTISSQVHRHTIAKEGANLLDGQTLGLRDVEVSDDERDDTKPGIDQEHAPLATFRSGRCLLSRLRQDLHALECHGCRSRKGDCAGEVGENSQADALGSKSGWENFRRPHESRRIDTLGTVSGTSWIMEEKKPCLEKDDEQKDKKDTGAISSLGRCALILPLEQSFGE